MPIAENGPGRTVFAGSQHGEGAVLVTNRGDPIPPQEVVKALRQVDPRLTIEWVNGAWGMSYFALKSRWREDDRRWEQVRNGQIDPEKAYDLETMFSPGVRTDEMVAWVRNRWGDRACLDPRAEAERIIQEQMKKIKDLENKAVDQVMETGEQRIREESDHQRLVRGGFEKAHPMVSGADFEPKRLLEK